MKFNLFKNINSHFLLKKKYSKIAIEVKKRQNQVFQKLSDEKLFNHTNIFKKELSMGKNLSDILIDVYSVSCEASRRILKLDPFHVQVMGACVLHDGDVAEMKTGEGKTLTSIMPAYLNALEGKGVHIATVNEYLVQRDAEEMGAVHNKLGLSVGVNLQKLGNNAKKKAYEADITYSIHSELGFDYLRDNMVQQFSLKVQRGHNFSIVDEADSILIDEARTPLIISSQAIEPKEAYTKPDKFVKTLKKHHFEVDEESKGISLTAEGIKYTEKYFNLQNLYDVRNTELTHRINNALKANFVFKKDVEYMVSDGKVLLIDQFTGRVMEGRSYSYGLQQAIQAKEGVKIEKETKTSATITYQNYFRLYDKLSGMTGTAKTEEEEFVEVYNMRVIEIPTNKPIIRKDDKDLVFGTKKAKLNAIVKSVEKYYKSGRPVLLGTITVNDSEKISKLLDKNNIPHNTLNAKNHLIEAKIIENAGQKGQVTISTNMAGRGTDIKITDEVRDLGGLVVIGSEKHEARRIDNQLRGRSGRQGDPGYSKFYVSIEDDLMARFGGPLIKRIFSSLKDDAINSPTLSRALLTTQKRIEGMNFESRKNVLNYDNVLSNQRNIMYKQRDRILLSSDISIIVSHLIKQVVSDFLIVFKKKEAQEEIIDYKKILEILNQKLITPGSITEEMLKEHTIEKVKELIQKEIFKMYMKKRSTYKLEIMHTLEQSMIIRILDQIWMHHIDSMDKLRRGIHLQAISQKNPIQLYIERAHSLFQDTKKQIAHRCLLAIFAAEIQMKQSIELKNEETLRKKQEIEKRITIAFQERSGYSQLNEGRFGLKKDIGWGEKKVDIIKKTKNEEIKNKDPRKGWT